MRSITNKRGDADSRQQQEVCWGRGGAGAILQLTLPQLTLSTPTPTLPPVSGIISLARLKARSRRTIIIFVVSSTTLSLSEYLYTNRHTACSFQTLWSSYLGGVRPLKTITLEKPHNNNSTIDLIQFLLATNIREISSEMILQVRNILTSAGNFQNCRD